MATFEDSWDLLVTTLKDAAATLQVPEYAIEEGKNTEPSSSPFVWVYCVPRVRRTSESSGKIRQMAVAVFCGCESTSLASALKSAVALAERCETVLEGVSGFTSIDIEYDDEYSNMSTVKLTGTMRYAKS